MCVALCTNACPVARPVLLRGPISTPYFAPASALARCVDRMGRVRSTDFWDARLRDEAKILFLIKTTAGRLDELQERLIALHPYELLELLAIEVAVGQRTLSRLAPNGRPEKTRMIPMKARIRAVGVLLLVQLLLPPAAISKDYFLPPERAYHYTTRF